MTPEILPQKMKPDNSGARQFGFGFGLARFARIVAQLRKKNSKREIEEMIWGRVREEHHVGASLASQDLPWWSSHRGRWGSRHAGMGTRPRRPRVAEGSAVEAGERQLQVLGREDGGDLDLGQGRVIAGNGRRPRVARS